MTQQRRRRRRGGRRGRAGQGTPAPAETGADRATEKVEKVYPINPAGPIKRAYAWTIDAGIILLLIFMLAPISGGHLFSQEAAAQDIFVILGYFIIPTGLFGRTPGKWVAGIIVVNAEGHVPGVAAAIPREMVGKLVAYAAVGLGLAWIVFDGKRQGWHDKIAGTYVVMLPESGGGSFLRRLLKIESPSDKGDGASR